AGGRVDRGSRRHLAPVTERPAPRRSRGRPRGRPDGDAVRAVPPRPLAHEARGHEGRASGARRPSARPPSGKDDRTPGDVATITKPKGRRFRAGEAALIGGRTHACGNGEAATARGPRQGPTAAPRRVRGLSPRTFPARRRASTEQ